MKEQRIQIENQNMGSIGTKYVIDGHEIKNIKSVNFSMSAFEAPVFKFETFGIPDIDITGEICFSFTPQTVSESIYVLRNELLKHGDLYNGFKASIESALKEVPAGSDPHDEADMILRRVIGEEQECNAAFFLSK